MFRWRIADDDGQATATLGPGQKTSRKNPKGLSQNQAQGDVEAGQEGHLEHLRKAGGPREDHYAMPPPELTQQVPPLPPLLLAGLA